MARRKSKYTYGFADVSWGGPMNKPEADFAAEKRRQGFTDPQIAKMMGRTVGSLSKRVIVDDGFISAADPEAAKREEAAERARTAERWERNRQARSLTTWHAPVARPREDSTTKPIERR